jgi:hypothetical protein
MFQHRSAIFRESANTKVYKFRSEVLDLWFCVSRLPENGTSVSKHVVLILVIKYILLYAFVGRYIEYTVVHCMSSEPG